MAAAGSQVALATSSNSLEVWDLSSGKKMRNWDGPIKYVASVDEGHVVAVSEARAGRKDDVFVWSWRSGRSIGKVPMKFAFSSIAASPSGGYVAAGDSKGMVHLWDVTNGWLLQVFPAHYKEVATMAFSPCGNFLLTGGGDAVVHSWMLADLVLLNPSDAPTPHTTFASLHTLPVTCIAFAPGGPGTLAVTGGQDGVLCTLEVAIGQKSGGVQVSSSITCVCLETLERFAYCGGADGILTRVSLGGFGRNSVEEYKGHSKEITGVGVTWEGTQVISGSLDGNIIIRDTNTMQIVRTIETRLPSINSLQIILDSKLVRASSGLGKEESRIKFPGLNRDYDPENRFPPSAKTHPDDSVSAPPLREHTHACLTPLPRKISALSRVQVAQPNPKRRRISKNAEKGDEKVLESDFLPLGEEETQAQELATVQSELEEWQRAGQELYRLCTEKIVRELGSTNGLD